MEHRPIRNVIVRHAAGLALLIVVTHTWPAAGQEVLTLTEAMARARRATPDARALDADLQASAARVAQARAGYWPRIDVSESAQRGDQPVFVFSSLLSQRRFAAENFAVQTLNHPAAVTNVRTAIMADQPVFDGGLTRLAVRQAELARDSMSAARDGASADLALRAAQAFVRVLQHEAAERASRAGLAAAESDLERSRARRDSGVATEADILAVEVHLADMRERTIAAAADVAVARLDLLEAIGAPLDAAVSLVRPVPSERTPDEDALVEDALASRPDRRHADLQSRLAETGRRAAQAAFLPRVTVQGGWELNGSTLTDQRASWIVGAQVQLNVFNGFGDRARVAEARHAEARAGAEKDRIERRIAVEVRSALARLEAARARETAGQTALAQARESQRIVRDRYEAGLATITDVLRAAEAALGAESRLATAETDLILQQVSLDRALGRL